jgi:hypothetical protein
MVHPQKGRAHLHSEILESSHFALSFSVGSNLRLQQQHLRHEYSSRDQKEGVEKLSTTILLPSPFAGERGEMASTIQEYPQILQDLNNFRVSYGRSVLAGSEVQSMAAVLMSTDHCVNFQCHKGDHIQSKRPNNRALTHPVDHMFSFVPVFASLFIFFRRLHFR